MFRTSLLLSAALLLAPAEAFLAGSGLAAWSPRVALPAVSRSTRSSIAGPRMLFVEVGVEDAELEEGGRKVVMARNIKVVVAKQEGKVYAFNNKCPHLGLSLKRGTITDSGDRHGVCVTCPFHNSKFSLEEGGKCKVWSERAFGIKGTEKVAEAIGGYIAPMAKSVNPLMKKGAPAAVYAAKVEGGKVLVDLPPDLSTYAQTRAWIGYQDYIDIPKKIKE